VKPLILMNAVAFKAGGYRKPNTEHN